LKPLQLLRRAAGKSPAYLARRGFGELTRRVRSPSLRRSLRSLTPAGVARRGGAVSLTEIWEKRIAEGFLFSEADGEELCRLHRRLYSSTSGALRRRVEAVLRHEFDLLGSGPTGLGPRIDWHLDFKSGYRWELVPSETIDYAELDRPSDVKVPWELSRGQHLTCLARAWRLDRNEACAREFESQVRSWIRENPVGLGVNWVSTMDVALRSVSWIWALRLFHGAPFSEGFRDEILLSLYVHGRWISRHLEFGEVNGNHLLSDALGLAACGCLFVKMPEGRGWLALGGRLLEREIRRQVDPDGVDIEASLAYHRLALEIFLVAARFLESAGREPSAEYRARLGKMFDFVHAYTPPEGSAPIVGDADDGRALVLSEMDVRDHRYLLSTGAALFGREEWKERAGRFWEDSLWLVGPSGYRRFESLGRIEDEGSHEFPDEGSHEFPVSGFYALRSPAQYLFVDAGPVGFRGTGGHGHNDCLSFEWHVGRRPLLTDSGSFVYTSSPAWRNRFRSTAFHNTIRVDGEELNRIPSPLALWSLRDDAEPLPVRFIRSAGTEIVEAGHTGYRRLPDPVTVRRTFEFDHGRTALRLLDRLDGAAEHSVEFFFHAAPGAVAARRSGSCVELSWPSSGRVVIERESGPDVNWEEREGWFSPSYGVKVARPVWVASVRIALPFVVVWRLSAEF
jgi:uncharacterized heparinase superfamily protein